MPASGAEAISAGARAARALWHANCGTRTGMSVDEAVQAAEGFEAFVFPGDGRVGRVVVPPGATKYELGFRVFSELEDDLAPGEFGLEDVSVLMHYQLASRPKMYAQVICLDRNRHTPHNRHIESLVERNVWGPCMLVFMQHVGEAVNAFEGVHEDDLVFHEAPLTLGAAVARLAEEDTARDKAGGNAGGKARAESESAVYLLERARAWDCEHTPMHKRAEQALRELHRGAHVYLG